MKRTAVDILEAATNGLICRTTSFLSSPPRLVYSSVDLLAIVMTGLQMPFAEIRGSLLHL